MTALANNLVFWIGLLVGLTALYVLPTTIAVIRNVEGIGLGTRCPWAVSHGYAHWGGLATKFVDDS
jgi:hypothetical protein